VPSNVWLYSSDKYVIPVKFWSFTEMTLRDVRSSCLRHLVIVIPLMFAAGGMQDFNYVWYGCMEVTLELSCCKYPSTSELPKLWEENRLVSILDVYNIHELYIS